MRAIVYKLADVFALVGGILLLAIILVTSTNVGAFALHRLLSPFGFTIPGLSGYEDFVKLAMSSAALLFFPLCQVKGGHIAVDIFIQYLPTSLQRLTEKLWAALTFCLVLFLAWWMVQGMLEVRSDHSVAGVLGWPEWPFYIPGILSLLLWAVACLVQILDPVPLEVTHA
ncbi:TRAP transporter small permease [Thiolinea disciformis]|uniref:TRAP transporter small permease n=1 Tax=Thiolinea disciformis TaxID=125614 RepID=UPI000378A9DF|nr:TRAP transporter small permease [Thiolinea disciformis]